VIDDSVDNVGMDGDDVDRAMKLEELEDIGEEKYAASIQAITKSVKDGVQLSAWWNATKSHLKKPVSGPEKMVYTKESNTIGDLLGAGQIRSVTPATNGAYIRIKSMEMNLGKPQGLWKPGNDVLLRLKLASGNEGEF
jgi:hypothetical protein